MIELLVTDIPNAPGGFRMIFSGQPFPGAQVRIDWLREEAGGNWYRWNEQNLEGWLCPALFKYFDQTPQSIWCKAEAL